MNGALLRFSAAFVAAALVVVSVSLYLSGRYLEEQQRLANTGDLEGAVEHAELAARLDPFSSDPLRTEAYLLQRQGMYEEAESAFRAAVKKEPSNYTTYQALGELKLRAMNRPAEAAESYQRSLELNPRSELSRTGSAESYLSAGELEAAKAQYEWLREQEGLNVEQMYDLGRIYVRTGEPEKGVRMLRQTKNRAEAGLQGLSSQQRQQQLAFLQSVELAIADALVVERRYAQARQVLANSSAPQAPTIISLIASDPESYRQTVINSDV